MRRVLLFFFLLLAGVSCKTRTVEQCKIAYDPLFADGHIGLRSGNMQGFFNEVVDLLSKEGIRVKKIAVGPDNINFVLENGEADLSFSTMNPNDQQKQWYDFSDPLLELGPVILVTEDFPGKVTNYFMGRIMGVSANVASQVSTVQAIRGVIIETFIDIALAYEKLAMKKLDGLLDLHMNAYYAVKNLYKDNLRIATRPLNEFGYRFISKKGGSKRVFEILTKKKHEIYKLREKWDLPN